MLFPFTREELEGLLKNDLYKVAEYYQIKINKRLLKSELIEAIWEGTHKQPKEEERQQKIDELIMAGELPPMSVRVRRIYEQNLLKE